MNWVIKTNWDHKIKVAIAELDEPYGNTILAHVNASLPQNWFTRRWPILNEIRGLGVGGLYPRLMRLENEGMITSEWSTERYPERGNRRRRYYRLTDQGHLWMTGP